MISQSGEWSAERPLHLSKGKWQRPGLAVALAGGGGGRGGVRHYDIADRRGVSGSGAEGSIMLSTLSASRNLSPTTVGCSSVHRV